MKRIILFLLTMILLSSCAWFTSAPKPESETKAPETNFAPELLIAAENYVSDGITYHKNGNDSLAVISWKKALEIIPADAEVHNFLGIAYHKLRKFDEAVDHFVLATELDTSYFQAYNNLGFLFFIQKQYADAMQAFNESLRINPDYEPAKQNLRKTENIINGDLLRAVFELTQEAERIDDVDKKIEFYHKVLALDSTYAEGHNNIAVAYFYADEIDSSYKHLRSAIRHKPVYPEALNNLGYIYKIAGRYEDSIKFFLKAVSLKKNYTIGLNNLGEAYYQNGEFQNARRVFRTALDLDPSNAFAKRYLADLSTIQEPEPEGE
jgi:protein O-GlcNAc transferase